jgi:hypothetical protein
VVDAGCATTEDPVVALRLVAGLHVYADAPDAVSVTLSPGHMAGEAGLTTTAGSGFTVTVTWAVSWQFCALETVTVYVWVEDGFALTAAPVVALRPVAGDQL